MGRIGSARWPAIVVDTVALPSDARLMTPLWVALPLAGGLWFWCIHRAIFIAVWPLALIASVLDAR
jgi:hypothetical protein